MFTPREVIDSLLWHTDGRDWLPTVTLIVAEFGPKTILPDDEYHRLRDKGLLNRHPGKDDVWERARRRRVVPSEGRENRWRRAHTENYWVYMALPPVPPSPT